MGLVQIYNPSDPRLGRHIVHDDRSWNFALNPMHALPRQPVLHARHVEIWDQGDIGSCTANAALGMISTGAFALVTQQIMDKTNSSWNGFRETDAVALYTEETLLDDREIPGHYPPDDTGSAGIYSCKALQKRGLIKTYRHMFTLEAALAALAKQPISIGIPWYNSMFEPSKRTGVVKIKGAVAGGHQICFDGIDPNKKLARFANSWGEGWGQDGWGWISFDDLGRLLKEGGDAVTVTEK